MVKTTISLLILALFACAIQEAHSSSLRTVLNAFAAQSGEVPIYKDSMGYYVEVDLDYKTNSTGNVAKMLLSLSSGQTLLGGCLGFDTYYCNAHNCTETQIWSTFSYPDFTTNAQGVNTEAYLDYSSWSLKAFGYLAGQCTTKKDIGYGYRRGGVIGLGTSGRSADSFIGSSIFSIYIDSNGNGSKLLFRYDDALTVSSTKMILRPDADWKTSLSTASLKVGFDYIYLSGNLIFDMNSNLLGFPLAVFNKIIASFRSYNFMTCTTSYTNPTCQFYGYISNLPAIYLNIGGYSIYIPPEIYLRDPRTSYQSVITLNFRALDPSLTGDNYVTDDFKNTVIFGTNFMNYYYPVFDQTYHTNTISLYVKGSRGSGSGFVFVIIAIVIVFLICGCAAKKRRQAMYPPPMVSEPMIVAPNLAAQPGIVVVQPAQQAYIVQQPYPVVHQHAVQQPGAYFPPPQQQYQQQQYQQR